MKWLCTILSNVCPRYKKDESVDRGEQAEQGA